MDSNPSEINALFAKDVFGFGLSYYENDYTAINGATPLANVQNTSHAAQNSHDLYNGNIRFMQTSIINPLDRTKMPMLNAYKYDQLNRLKESRSYENGLSGNTWNPTTYNNAYYNAFSYDAMGNILTQERHNRAGQKFDDLEYHYQKDANGNLLRNRLYSVSDDPDLASVMEDDIEDMDAFISAVDQINTNNNYSYDAEGRLVKDKQEEIDTIIWTVSGKVKEIRRSLESTKKNLIFEYDAFGNRIAKHVYDNQTLMLEKSTYYILDAQGNQLSMYEHAVDDTEVNYYLTERNIYGSSRLGTLKDPVNMFDAKPLPSYGIIGNRHYELSNHLGNVLTVISDIKYPLSSDNTTIDNYEVGISNVFDYSPFGAPLDGRTIENIFHHPSQNNGSQIPADTVEIYNNDFDNPPATASPYYSTEVTLDAHLSNTTWTSSTGAFTNYNSSGAGSGKSIAITTASADTAYLTLTMDVDSGYELDITSYSFAHRSSSTGYDSYKLVVNGIEIGTGSIYVASSGSTLQSTGVVNVSNVVSGVTGTVNVVLKLYGGLHGSTGTFRMDDFILNGYTQEENTGNGSGNGYVVMGGYRYGFNGKENDDEVIGKGRWQDYGERMYRPELGRFFCIDPFTSMYPFYSPYQFAGNKPIWKIDLDGLEEADPDMAQKKINERVDALKIQYEKMIWNARSVGANVAAANLQHFLDGSGSPRTLAASWLRSFSVIKDGEKRIKGYFQNKNIPTWSSGMKVGQSINRSDYWIADIKSYNPFNELSYASGASKITATGDFKLTKTDKNTISVSGTVIMNWNDPYDWHEGLGFYIPGSGSISDEDALFLEQHGGAQSFDMQSAWKYTFTGEYNSETKKWSNVKWEYKGKVSPSNGTEGSGDATRRDNRREYRRDRDQRRTRESTRRR